MKYQIITLILILTCALTTKSQWTPDPFCPFPSDHVTRYPYYGNCSVYWECYEGTKYVMECPEGLEFNAPLQQCDTPEIANCDPLASTTANPNPPTWTTVSTTSHKPGPNCPYPSDELIYFPYVGDCTKYWECYEGNSYLYNCPSGLWWHQEISECDYPGDFCNNSTATPTDTTNSMSTTTDSDISTTTPHGLPDCIGSGEDPVYYPYEGDCTKYYECANGKLYSYDCPSGLWWHQSISECDYPGEYCTNGTQPTEAPITTTTTSDVPECDPNSDVQTYYPYKGDCTKYWECYQGKLYSYSCSDGLWWHQEITNCDYPGSYCS